MADGNSDFFDDLISSNSHTHLSPAVIEVDDDQDVPAISLFHASYDDPVSASDCSDMSRLHHPTDLSAAWGFANKYDFPVTALAIQQYARTARYGYGRLSHPMSGKQLSPTQEGDHRLQAFVMAAQMGDYMLCANLLERDGGPDLLTPPAGHLHDSAGDMIVARNPSDRYTGQQAERCHIFDVAGWSREMMEQVGRECAWGLMRAIKTVGPFY